ncbi:MAG: DUF2975 domain-containing protein [Flavobacteriales bacterium]|nr:DUF2975 domain-containing protein [Flavobacteriales bacterium]
MTSTNATIFKTMQVLFWIAFIGLCIKTGALMVSFTISLLVNATAAKDLYLGLNLFELYQHDTVQYGFVASLVISIMALKAYIAYLVVKLFMKFDLNKPFQSTITQMFLQMSYVALGTGILTIIAEGYIKHLINKGIAVPIESNGSETFFFAGVIYLLALVFQKGVELQTENDLTV